MPTPPYGLAPDAVIQMVLEMSFNAQTLLLVRHYRQDPDDSPVSITDGPQAIAQLISEWDDAVAGITTTYSQFATEAVQFQQIRGQAITPIRYGYLTGDVLYPTGIAVGEPAQQNQTIVGTLRSAATGPHSHGNVFLAGFPVSYLDEGYVTETGKTSAMTVLSACTRVLETTTEPARFSSCIFNRSSPATSEFIYTQMVQSTARVMNRRTVGRGI